MPEDSPVSNTVPGVKVCHNCYGNEVSRQTTLEEEPYRLNSTGSLEDAANSYYPALNQEKRQNKAGKDEFAHRQRIKTSLQNAKVGVPASTNIKSWNVRFENSNGNTIAHATSDNGTEFKGLSDFARLDHSTGKAGLNYNSSNGPVPKYLEKHVLNHLQKHWDSIPKDESGRPQ
jgi:hypothetical protein